MPDSKQPLVETKAEATPETKPQKSPKVAKKRGVLIGGIIALIIVLIAGAVFYFTVWQKPTTIVMDAVVNALQAKHGEATGDARLTLKPLNDATLDVHFVANKASGNSGTDVKLTYTSQSVKKPVVVTTKAILAENGDVYVKADNISAIITTFYSEMNVMSAKVGSSDSSSQQLMAGPLMASIGDYISNKWIKLPLGSDTDKTDNTLTCLQRAIAKFNANSSERDAIVKAYKENDFLIVDADSLPKEGNSKGFLITTDADKLEGFKKAAKDTTSGKLLASCLENNDNSSLDDYASSDTATKASVWIDSRSHTLTHVKLASDDGASKLDVRFNFNAKPTVTIPNDAKTITQLFSPESIKAEAKQ